MPSRLRSGAERKSPVVAPGRTRSPLRGRGRVVPRALLFSDTPGLALGAAANAAALLAGRSFFLRKLTPAAVAAAATAGTLAYAAFGPRSYLFVLAWLLLCSFAPETPDDDTANGAAPAAADPRSTAAAADPRSPASVWGSASAAIGCALSAFGGVIAPDLCRMGFVAGMSSAIVGAMALRGTFSAVALSLVLAFLAMIPLRQITLADWLGCAITTVFANAVHAVLRFALRDRAALLTGDVANALHVSLAAALAMHMMTCGAAQPRRQMRRAASSYGEDAPHIAGDPRYAEAHAAVDALLHVAQAAEADQSAMSAALVESSIDQVAFLGERLRLDRVVPAWNAGCFQGHAVAGRLRDVLAAPLTMPALSFGLFAEPAGRVTLSGDASRILKGDALPGAPADAYAVRSVFSARCEATGAKREGVNTVIGTFELPQGDDEAREMDVQFTHVRLELLSADGERVETCVMRELKQPARVTLRVLLMTPDVTVTRSSLGSLAVLKRRDA